MLIRVVKVNLKGTYEEPLDPIWRREHGVAAGVVQATTLGYLHVGPNHAHQVIGFCRERILF